MVEIKGLEKFAPKDFAGHIASTVFLGGCNFLCPFCQNVDLVLRPDNLPTFSMDYFMSYLDSRKGWLEGICVTGGEPLMSPDLEVLLHIIKDRGLLVKLDTNGSLPERLEDVLGAGLVDHVAMDVKAPIERYREVTRSEIEDAAILRSIALLRGSGLPVMFRTTAVPGIIEADDLLRIGRMVEGADLFQLQQFSPLNTMEKELLAVKPYTREKLEEFAELLRPFFKDVRLEGV